MQIFLLKQLKILFTNFFNSQIFILQLRFQHVKTSSWYVPCITAVSDELL